jgi:hypothetical protein
MNIIITPELRTFLKEKRVLTKFIKNTKAGAITAKCYFGTFHVYSICQAFIWSESPEGHLFWERLSQEI